MQLDDRSLSLRLLAVAAVAAGAAVMAGLVTGGITYGLLAADASDDGWAELGAAIFGLGVGVVAGSVTYAVVVALAVQRVQPKGSRIRPAAALILLPVAVMLGAGAASAAAGPYSPEAGIAVASIAFFGGVLVAHAGIAGAARARPAAIAAVTLVALGIVATATTAIIADRQERTTKRDAIERIGVLPLVDGRSLDEPYPGWTLRRVHYSSYSEAIDVTWDAGEDGDAHLSIDPARGYEVRVHTPDGLAIERDLLRRLQPVRASTFLEACGRHC